MHKAKQGLFGHTQLSPCLHMHWGEPCRGPDVVPDSAQVVVPFIRTETDCSDHIDPILSRGSHSSQEKGEREIRRESYRRWNLGLGADGECLLTAPPHLNVKTTVARPPSPLSTPFSPLPHFEHPETSVTDLCDGLSMEVMGTKTDIGQ